MYHRPAPDLTNSPFLMLLTMISLLISIYGIFKPKPGSKPGPKAEDLEADEADGIDASNAPGQPASPDGLPPQARRPLLKEIIDLPAWYPFRVLKGSKKRVPQLLRTLEAENPGMVPVILGESQSSLDAWEATMADRSYDTQAILQEAEGLYARQVGRYSEIAAASKFSGPLDEEFAAPESGDSPSVFIALVPAKEPWEIPAWFNLGGQNGCPSPAVHVARLRLWQETFGARLYLLRPDFVELRLPQELTLGDLKFLAREHIAYNPGHCDDPPSREDVLSCMEGLETRRAWYFWWD